MQFNVRYGAVSSRAVDGNADGVYHRSGTCTFSLCNYATNPWWRVDLASCYSVTRVVVYSRVDCCSERLIDMEIRIGTVLLLNKKIIPCTLLRKRTETIHCQ